MRSTTLYNPALFSFPLPSSLHLNLPSPHLSISISPLPISISPLPISPSLHLNLPISPSHSPLSPSLLLPPHHCGKTHTDWNY